VRAHEYQRAAKNLDDFLVAFHELVQDLEPVRDGFMGTRWRPKPDRLSDVNKHASELARLAGPAAEAFDISGIGMDYKPSGTFQTQSVNPAMIWSTILAEPMYDPSTMAIVGREALGMLEHKRSEQAARQRGLIGALAWFFTVAPRVRGAAGLPARSVRGQAVTWITVIIQGLIVTTIGGVLIYPLAKVLGWYP
jgi:hypothetical protein